MEQAEEIEAQETSEPVSEEITEESVVEEIVEEIIEEPVVEEAPAPAQEVEPTPEPVVEPAPPAEPAAETTALWNSVFGIPSVYAETMNLISAEAEILDETSSNSGFVATDTAEENEEDLSTPSASSDYAQNDAASGTGEIVTETGSSAIDKDASIGSG